MKIKNVNEAYRKLLAKLTKEGFILFKILEINQKRYLIFKGEPENLMVLFKREPFYNFGRILRPEGYNGVGDTINCHDLKTAIQHNVQRIYVIFARSGTVNTITTQEFLQDSIKWTNKEGKEVRSISIHKFEKFCEV